MPTALIRESLRHPDADIRSVAARYFHGAQDCGGATMADWWAAVDALGFAAAGHLLRDLGELPDTDATLARFFDELRKGLPAKVWFPLCQRLTALPFATLERHIGDVRDASHLLTPGDVRHAEDRLALANLPPDVLWKKLLAHAVECDGKHAASGIRGTPCAQDSPRRIHRRLARDFCERTRGRTSLPRRHRAAHRKVAHRYRLHDRTGPRRARPNRRL